MRALLRGRPGEISFLLGLIALCSLVTIAQFYTCALQGRCIFAEDFDVFYVAAKHLATGEWHMLYSVEQARAWLDDAPDAPSSFHFSLYPPQGIWLLYPLGLMPRLPALTFWYMLQFALLVLALRTKYARNLLGDDGVALACIALPFVMMSVMAAQVGMLCAALFIFVLAWRKSHPLRAGLILALLSLKPQLGLVLPLLLLAEGNWKALCAAFAGVAVMVAVSLLMPGLTAWEDYLSLMQLYRQVFLLAPEQLLTIGASAYCALRLVGIDGNLGLILQLALSVVAVLACFLGFRRARSEEQRVILAALATFLISPYIFIYDTVILILPCMLWLKVEKLWSTGGRRIAFLLLAFIPIAGIKLQHMGIPYSALVLLFAFSVAFKSFNFADTDA